MKYLAFVAVTFLTSCKLTEFIVEHEQAITNAGDTASGLGPYGALAAFMTSTVVAGAKWYEHKMSAKEVVKATQKAKDELPEASKKLLRDAYNTHMPSKIKNYVGSIKKKL